MRIPKRRRSGQVVLPTPSRDEREGGPSLACRGALLGLASVVALAAAAACAGGAPKDLTENVCDSPGVTRDQVELGLILTDSGPSSAAFSAARAGVDARLGLANAEGGVHGRRIAYAWRDDEDSRTRNAYVAKELVDEERVLGLVTVTTAIGPSMEFLAGQGVPVVGLAGSPDWLGHPNMFSYAFDPSPVPVGRYIQASGGRKAAIVASGTAETTAGAADRFTQALRSANIDVVGLVPYSRAVDSPTQIAQRLGALRADALVALTTAEELAALLPAMRAAGSRLAVTVALSGYDHARLARLGPALAGVSFPVYFRPFEAGGPAIDRYRGAMGRFAAQAIRAEQEYSMNAYIYTDLFLYGLEKAGPCPTREGIIRALRATSGYDAGGLVDPVDLRSSSGLLLDCYAFVQVSVTGDAFQPVQERVCGSGA